MMNKTLMINLTLPVTRSGIIKGLHQLERFGIYSLAFFLPIMESPKHMAIAILFLGALGRRLAEKPVRWRHPDTFEWLLLGMWLTSLASTLTNWPLPTGIKGFKDASCFLLIFWIMYRSDAEHLRVGIFLGSIIIGVITGLIWGICEWQSGIRPYLEFHSAGLVTQSSIYLGISIFLMFGVLLDSVSGFTTEMRRTMALCLLFSLSSLIVMGSRGGVLGFMIAAGLLMVVFFRNRNIRKSMGISLLLPGMVILIALLIGEEDSELVKRIGHLKGNVGEDGLKLDDEEGPNDRLRFEHWLVGYAQATQGGKLLLGIGPRNFPSVNVDQLCFKAPLKTYPSVWQIPEHAHNLFLTKLCEEGILGLILFLLFLWHVAWDLIRYRPAPEKMNWAWIASLGALVCPIVAGIFNSPFINEFAWLSMMIMGFGMQLVRRNPVSDCKDMSCPEQNPKKSMRHWLKRSGRFF